MKRYKHANGVVTYAFESLAGLPISVHVSARHGGVSPAPWESLNFSVSRGDTPEHVAENRRRLCEALYIPVNHLVRCTQVHGTGVAKVEATDAGAVQEHVDALITDAIRLPLFLVFADCVPLILYDPIHHALGICHAGWRGTVHGIVMATLWAMSAAYGTEPSDVWAGIGPSIGPNSYEVGDDVVSLAKAKIEKAEQYFACRNDSDNLYFDLWRANAGQLEMAGIRRERIEFGGIDTATNTHEFFSHRAEKGRCGLFGMVAWLDER